MGIGLIMPVLPTLLREFIASEDIANHFGVLLALYALMQVIFAPWLGKMSDRFWSAPSAVVVINRRIAGLLIAGFFKCALDAVFRPFASGITGATGLSRHRSLPIPPQLLNA